jgi:plastocyanin
MARQAQGQKETAMYRFRTVLLGVLLLGLLSPGSATAATISIQQIDYIFAPQMVRAVLGDTVEWTNKVTAPHTSTADDPLVLWDSGHMQEGETFTYTFTAAGTYSYECTIHTRFGMFGRIVVKDNASPPSGPPGTLFTITVATTDAPGGLVYDIQKKEPGGTFQDWMTGVTKLSVTFDSTGVPTGIYRFRSRVRQTSDGAAIGYSPPASISVTP